MPSVGTITGTLRLVDIFTGPLAVANKKLAATATQMQVTGQKMAVAGGRLTTGLTIPIVAAGAAAFFFASQFEEPMTKVKPWFGPGRRVIRGWKTDLLPFVEEGGRSQVDLAEALFFLSLVVFG